MGGDGDTAVALRVSAIRRIDAPAAPAPCCPARAWEVGCREKRRPAPSKGKTFRPRQSRRKLHAIVCHLDARRVELTALRAAFVEDRVGVVDVDQYPAAVRQPAQERQTAIRAAQRPVGHLTSAALAEALRAE